MVGSQLSNIARPDPPQRTVVKFDDVALVVFLDEHRTPRCSLSGQPGRGAGLWFSG